MNFYLTESGEGLKAMALISLIIMFAVLIATGLGFIGLITGIILFIVFKATNKKPKFYILPSVITFISILMFTPIFLIMILSLMA